jgi:hypothetical protein
VNLLLGKMRFDTAIQISKFMFTPYKDESPEKAAQMFIESLVVTEETADYEYDQFFIWFQVFLKKRDAIPDLLEASKAALYAMESSGHGYQFEYTAKTLKDAIAKAEGK